MGAIGPSFIPQILRRIPGPFAARNGLGAGYEYFQYFGRALPAGFATKLAMPDIRAGGDWACGRDEHVCYVNGDPVGLTDPTGLAPNNSGSQGAACESGCKDDPTGKVPCALRCADTASCFECHESAREARPGFPAGTVFLNCRKLCAARMGK